MKGMTCTCGPANFGWMVVQAVAFGVGFTLFVCSANALWTGKPWLNAAGWAILGALVISIGKWCKWKSHQGCPVHQY